MYVGDVTSKKIRFVNDQDVTWLISAPLTSNKSGDFIGVIVNRINAKILSNIMAGRSTFVSHPESRLKRIGATGESYIVNRDKLMVTESRFLDNVILDQVVDTEPVRFAQEHGMGMVGSYPDYRGIAIIGASKQIKETGWLILTEIDRDEALLPIRRFIIIAIVIAVIIVPVIFFITLFFVRKIIKPILDVTETSERISQGHWDERVTTKEKKGEIARLANAFNLMVKFLVESRNTLEIRVKEQTSELRNVNEEIRRFAYIVSHDLRAPLVNIKGFSGELRSALEVINTEYETVLPHLTKKQKDEIHTALNEDIPEALEFIESSASRMDRLITAVLSLSRMGRRDMVFGKLNMNDIVDTITKSLTHEIKAKSIRFIIGKLPEVVADRISMEQIMGNILQNAVNYIDHNSTGEIEITGSQDEKETAFNIKDNGPGIAEHEVGRVFDVFYRGGTRKVHGEGMGLAYAKLLIQMHNGHIRCESKPGEGTVFSFNISNHIL